MSTYDYFPAAPIHVDTMFSRLKKYGLWEHIPSPSERLENIRIVTDGEKILHIYVDTKGFIRFFKSPPCFVGTICDEFDTYSVCEALTFYKGDLFEDESRAL